MDLFTRLAADDKNEEPTVKYLWFDLADNDLPDTPTTQDQVQKSITINELPAEMLMKVFSYLDTEDLLDTVRHMSPYWNSLVKSSPVWKTQVFSVSRTGTSEVEASKDSASAIDKSISRLKNFPHIKRIAACGLRWLETKKLLNTLYKHCVEVRSLDLSDCSIKDSTFLNKIFQKFRSIQDFSAISTFEIAQYYVNAVKGCENLKCLTLYAVDEGIDSVLDLTPIAEGCTNLQHLKLSCSVYDPDSLALLLKKKSSQLKSLDFGADFLRVDTELPFKNCTSLTGIRCCVFYRRISKELLECLCSAPALKTLDLIDYKNMCITMMMEFFRNCYVPHLEELNFSLINLQCPKSRAIWKSSLGNIGIFPISWRYTKNNWKTKKMFTLENLNHLALVDWKTFSDDWVDELAQCNDLEGLNIMNCATLCDKQFSKIIRHMKLRHLDLVDCKDLTDKVFDHIAQKGEYLKELVVRNCKFSGARVLDVLPKMRIDSIHILKCSNITQEDVRKMKKYVNTVHYL